MKFTVLCVVIAVVVAAAEAKPQFPGADQAQMWGNTAAQAASTGMNMMGSAAQTAQQGAETGFGEMRKMAGQFMG